MVKLSLSNIKKQNWLQFFILILLGVLLTGGFGILQHQKVQAFELPQESVEISSNNWQYASFPVENFQSYSSPFGYRISPTGGTSKEFHKGLDIVAPMGSYVRNWWTGTVVSLSDNTACGTSIQIKSGDWLHIYCHLKGNVKISGNSRYLNDTEGGIQLWLGEEIPVGARIGRIGMTGRTTGPHLHWGLKYAGKYVDPGLVLQEMYKGQSA